VRRADRRELPREHWGQIASTNPLERVNREIKRRADGIGVRAFLRTVASGRSNQWRDRGRPVMPSLPNDAAIVRLVGAFATGPEPVATSWVAAGDQRRVDRRAALHVA
jgi:hypothetical protein